LRYLYSLLTYIAAPLFSVVLLIRGLRDRSYWHNFSQRFGYGPPAAPSPIWVHAVSVGEVQASAALVNSLRERYPEIPIVVTTFTPTGAGRARTYRHGQRHAIQQGRRARPEFVIRRSCGVSVK